MKKPIFIVIFISLFISLVFYVAWGQDEIDTTGTFIAESQDFEEDTLGSISVLQKREEKLTWTLNEIDFYISSCETWVEHHEAELKKYKKYIKDYTILREKVEKVAKKVQLKEKGERL